MEINNFSIEKKDYEFKEAKKIITSKELLDKFLTGETFKKLMEFICFLQKSIEGKSRKETPFPENKPIFVKFREQFQYLYKLLEETPPLENPQRFGNKAFKIWYDKVEENYDSIMKNLLSEQYNADLALELKSYYLDCFGSSKRIDYGTGHEINFICILYILMCTGIFDISDAREIIHHIFFEYILLVRNIQIKYKLEPAGAHGVWGLDEYHFLPFLFGASELINHDTIVPESILDDKIIKEYADTYIYISCIQYIKTVKKGGPFQNYSPTLASICNVPNWRKVSQGLVKMYVDELFKKWVIMQHFYFGSVIRFE